MEIIFDSLGKEIYSLDGQQRHKGYIMKWYLISPFCKQWSRNRVPDSERVKEMIEYHNKGGYIPRMIHLADTKEEGIVCYDGNHRKEVFNNCNDKSLECIVDVVFDASQNDVFDVFNNINKSIQLPAIYVEDLHDKDIKTNILRLVKVYETKYKPFLSTSIRCHAPNFNRDVFIDNIYNIYKYFHGVVDISEIESALIILNTEYSQGRLCRSHSFYKQTVIEKCKKYNMFLFLERYISPEIIEQIMNKSYMYCV